MSPAADSPPPGGALRMAVRILVGTICGGVLGIFLGWFVPGLSFSALGTAFGDAYWHFDAGGTLAAAALGVALGRVAALPGHARRAMSLAGVIAATLCFPMFFLAYRGFYNAYGPVDARPSEHGFWAVGAVWLVSLLAATWVGRGKAQGSH